MKNRTPRYIQHNNRTARIVRLILQAPKSNGHGKKKLTDVELEKLFALTTLRKIMEDEQ